MAISSAESELYATVKTTAEAWGIRSMWSDLGIQVRVSVQVDASAALGIIERKGLGKVRHIETSHLGIQETAARRQVKFGQVKGQKNLADLMAKELATAGIRKHIASIGGEFLTSRADLAAELDVLEKVDEKEAQVNKFQMAQRKGTLTIKIGDKMYSIQKQCEETSSPKNDLFVRGGSHIYLLHASRPVARIPMRRHVGARPAHVTGPAVMKRCKSRRPMRLTRVTSEAWNWRCPE